MHRTARRRALHHVDHRLDPDPADVPCRAGAVARLLVPVIAGSPDALTAERLVSDAGAAWTAAELQRVALAVDDEPEPIANAALHALAWTLRSADAAAFADRRADAGEPSPPWAADLGAATPRDASGITAGPDRLAFIAFDGPEPHLLAVGTFGGRRARLGLLRTGTAWEDATPLALEDAAGLLRTALALEVCGDGGADLRHLARRRLEALEG